MPDFDYYRKYLEAGHQEAERYLLSNDLFWTLNIAPTFGEPGYPNLTLGTLLLYETYARTLARTGSELAALDKIQANIHAVRNRWQVAWERKAAWEFKSRLRKWGDALKEIRIDPEDHIPYYHYDVRLRVLIDLLQDEIREVNPEFQEHLDSLDLLLRALFSHGDFIWDPDLAEGFPTDKYWYLWGVLKEP
jgi:hypothetical protein